jgi:ribonuclease Z
MDARWSPAISWTAARWTHLVFSGDTRPTATLLEATRGADLLIHEATFSHEEGARAWRRRHSTAHEAAIIARDAGCGSWC